VPREKVNLFTFVRNLKGEAMPSEYTRPRAGAATESVDGQTSVVTKSSPRH
jgi:hypothetical protein